MANVASEKILFIAHAMHLRTRASFSKYLPNLTFFSEQQTLKSITHLFFFSPPSCCLQDFLSFFLT